VKLLGEYEKAKFSLSNNCDSSIEQVKGTDFVIPAKGEQDVYAILVDKDKVNSECLFLAKVYSSDIKPSIAHTYLLEGDKSALSIKGSAIEDNYPGDVSFLSKVFSSMMLYGGKTCDIPIKEITKENLNLNEAVFEVQAVANISNEYSIQVRNNLGILSDCLNIESYRFDDLIGNLELISEGLIKDDNGRILSKEDAISLNVQLNANKLLTENFDESVLYGLKIASCDNELVNSTNFSGSYNKDTGIMSLENKLDLSLVENEIVEVFGYAEDTSGNKSCIKLGDFVQDKTPPSLLTGIIDKEIGSILGVGFKVRTENELDVEKISIYSSDTCSDESKLQEYAPVEKLEYDYQINMLGKENTKINIYGVSEDLTGNKSVCHLLGSYTHDNIPPSLGDGELKSIPEFDLGSDDNNPEISFDNQEEIAFQLFKDKDCLVSRGEKSSSERIYSMDDGANPVYIKLTDIAGNSSLCINTNKSYIVNPLKCPIAHFANKETRSCSSRSPIHLGGTSVLEGNHISGSLSTIKQTSERLYFQGKDETGGVEKLYSIDSADKISEVFSSTVNGVYQMEVINDKLFFIAKNTSDSNLLGIYYMITGDTPAHFGRTDNSSNYPLTSIGSTVVTGSNSGIQKLNLNGAHVENFADVPFNATARKRPFNSLKVNYNNKDYLYFTIYNNSWHKLTEDGTLTRFGYGFSDIARNPIVDCGSFVLLVAGGNDNPDGYVYDQRRLYRVNIETNKHDALDDLGLGSKRRTNFQYAKKHPNKNACIFFEYANMGTVEEPVFQRNLYYVEESGNPVLIAENTSEVDTKATFLNDDIILYGKSEFVEPEDERFVNLKNIRFHIYNMRTKEDKKISLRNEYEKTIGEFVDINHTTKYFTPIVINGSAYFSVIFSEYLEGPSFLERGSRVIRINADASHKILDPFIVDEGINIYNRFASTELLIFKLNGYYYYLGTFSAKDTNSLFRINPNNGKVEVVYDMFPGKNDGVEGIKLFNNNIYFKSSSNQNTGHSWYKLDPVTQAEQAE